MPPRKVLVTGATGFVGAHVTRALVERGDSVRAGYRNPKRLELLGDLDAEPVKGEILDLKAMRKAMRGCDTVFHVAGFVASKPVEKVWELNQRGPIIAVEAAAMEDVERIVLTSTISAVGTANGRPADEDNPYPEEGLGLVYADAKRGGEREAIAAGERLGVEVVVVNPAYVLGVPLDRSQPGETSTRIVGNYLRGRLPAVLDAPINFVDVEDVADGHLLAADKGNAGERYILGGHNRPWAEMIDMVAHASGVHHPIIVLPGELGHVARAARAARPPGRDLRRGVRADGPGLALHLRQGQARARLQAAPARPDGLGDRRVVHGADRGRRLRRLRALGDVLDGRLGGARRPLRALVAAAPG